MNQAVRNICLTSPQHLPYAQDILGRKFPGEDVQLMTLTLATDIRGLLIVVPPQQGAKEDNEHNKQGTDCDMQRTKSVRKSFLHETTL